jgi:hypothetical protein
VRAELDPRSQADLDRAIKKLAEASGSTVKEVLPSQMRLYAADLAFNTRPIGKSPKDAEAGRNRVATRVGAVYKPVGTAYDWLKRKEVRLARAFSRMVTEKRFTDAADLLNKHTAAAVRYHVGMFDDGKLHRKQGDSKRVTECLITVDLRKAERYLKDTQKKVGFAKGGFATAARELGGVRGIPGFATRQNAPGRGYIRGEGAKFEVILENHVDYIDKALDRAGEERAAQHRAKSINITLRRTMDNKIGSISKVLK